MCGGMGYLVWCGSISEGDVGRCRVGFARAGGVGMGLESMDGLHLDELRIRSDGHDAGG